MRSAVVVGLTIIQIDGSVDQHSVEIKKIGTSASVRDCLCGEMKHNLGVWVLGCEFRLATFKLCAPSCSHLALSVYRSNRDNVPHEV